MSITSQHTLAESQTVLSVQRVTRQLLAPHFLGLFFFSLSEPIGKFSQGELKQCCLIRMVYFIGDRNRNIPSSNTEDKRKTKEGRAEVSQNTGYTRIR